MLVDRNGLVLSKYTKGRMNAYRGVTWKNNLGLWQAYARSSVKTDVKVDWTLHLIAYYEDERDAAYVAQTFEAKYKKADVDEMLQDGTYQQVVKDFTKAVTIPKWLFASVGYSKEEIAGKRVREDRAPWCTTVQDALTREASRIGLVVPLSLAKELKDAAQKKVDADPVKTSFRKAAELTLMEFFPAYVPENA